MTKRRLLFLTFFFMAVSACGGGSGGPGSPPEPPPVTSTFTVTLTDAVVVRTADSLQLDAGGVPVDGATVSITETN